MAFRISLLMKSGQREKSLLFEKAEALISSSKDADMQVDLAEKGSLLVRETSYGCTLETKGLTVKFKDQKISNGSLSLTNGGQVEISDREFFITPVKAVIPIRHKKSILASLAFTLSVCMLILQVAVPLWLPSKIMSHTVKGREILLESTSKRLDDLRSHLSKASEGIEKISQTHRDALFHLNEEIEQIAWVFRNGSEFMTSQDLEQVLVDIALYDAVLRKLPTTKLFIV
jgi:hypothetical protein